MKKMMLMNMMIIFPCTGHEGIGDDQDDDHHDDDDQDDDDRLLPHLVGGPWSCGTLPRLTQCSTEFIQIFHKRAQIFYRS